MGASVAHRRSHFTINISQLMNTLALITWLASIITVTGFTGYFFYRVLASPHEPHIPHDEDDVTQGPKTFDAT